MGALVDGVVQLLALVHLLRDVHRHRRHPEEDDRYHRHENRDRAAIVAGPSLHELLETHSILISADLESARLGPKVEPIGVIHLCV